MLMSVLMMLGAMSLASCSDDDDDNGGSAPTPEFSSLAARYSISSNATPYKSIEFTESGNYIITPRSSYAKANNTRAFAQSHKKKGLKTRADYGESTLLVGSYTYNWNDSTYVLDSLGTVKVTLDKDGAYYNVVLVDKAGNRTEVAATKDASDIQASTKTNLLCRTWTISTLEETIYNGGAEIFHWSGGFDKLQDWKSNWLAFLKKIGATNTYNDYADDELYDDEDGLLSQEIFTKSGTWIEIYQLPDGHKGYEIYYWAWLDEGKNIIKVSDDPNFYQDKPQELSDDWEGYDPLQLTFSGSSLIMEYEDYESEADFYEDITKDQTNEEAYRYHIKYTFN